MHPSRIFLSVLLSFMMGVALRSFIELDTFGFYVIGLAGIVAAVLVHPKINYKVTALAVIFLVAGIWRTDLAFVGEPQPDELRFYNDQELVIQGFVVDEPDVRDDHTKLTVEASGITHPDSARAESPLSRGDLEVPSIKRGGRAERGRGVFGEVEVSGKALVNVSKYSDFNYGDELKFECDVKTPEKFDDFDYAAFLAKNKIYSVCFRPGDIEKISAGNGSSVKAFALSLKSRMSGAIEKSLSFPQSELVKAMTLGLRGEFPENLRQDFSRTGTSHIIAISGLHITILGSIISYLLIAAYFKRQHAFWPALIILIGFIFLIGFRASAVRAGIMGILILIAEKEGRLYASTNALVFAAAILLAFNPMLLRWDLGFQLSFMAVLGIVKLGPYFKKFFEKHVPGSNWLSEQASKILTMTFSAQIFVFPLVLWSFGTISLISPVVNLLVLIIVPGVMIGGLLVGLAGLAWLPLAGVLGWLVWLPATYIIETTKLFAKIPLASLKFEQVPLWWAAALYALIGLILWKRPKLSLEWPRFVKLIRVNKKPPFEELEVEEIDLEDFEKNEKEFPSYDKRGQGS